MKENTFTYTARSAQDASKMAMFTLHNGSVSVDLGNALLEQVGEAHDSANVGETEDRDLKTWIKPAATGAVQRLVKPIPLADFDAEMSENGELQATAWVRAAGLRLVPIMMTWQEVDNQAGAEAFVDELQKRKESLSVEQTSVSPLDYWVSWIVIGMMAIALPVLLLRQWQKQRTP